MTTGFEDIQKVSKENMDKAMSAFGAWSKGVQALSAEVGEGSKKAFEANSAFVQQILGAKSFDKAVELQTDFARKSYESFVAQTAKLNEIVVDMTKSAVKPFEVVAKK